MKLFIDGVEYLYHEQAVQDLELRLKKENRVISSMFVNNVEMVNAYLEEVLKDPDPNKVVSIETVQAKELVEESMQAALDYIPRLQRGLSVLREFVLGEEKRKALKMIEEALEGLEWLGLTFRAYISQKGSSASYKLFQAEYTRLFPVYQELEKALSTGNLEQVSDLFEGEVVPFLDNIFALGQKLTVKERT